jgi:serine/threonine-protein kinase
LQFGAALGTVFVSTGPRALDASAGALAGASMSPQNPHGGASAGDILDGAYKLTRLISEGGMGTVYEAVQMRLGRRVAVKIMAPELAENAEALARFRREVEVTSQLSHPHVIQLLDFGTAPTGQPYLVMEYLEGEDLEQRLARVGRLPVPGAVDVIKQVAAALTAIHARGIVHRDLKPANVFLLGIEGAMDFVKVVDFGISKVRTAKTKLTQAFLMVGTPNFMSPEQATGRVDDVDHRSDQWALGCIAYQILSGRLPFSAPDVNSVLQQVVNAEPQALGSLVPDLPPEVESVVRRALAKNQADRFPTITAFARALEAAAAVPAPPAPAPAPQPPQGRPASVPRRSGAAWALAVGAIVSLVTAAVYYRATTTGRLTPPAGPPSAAPPETRAPAAARRPPPRPRTASSSDGERGAR